MVVGEFCKHCDVAGAGPDNSVLATQSDLAKELVTTFGVFHAENFFCTF